MPREFVRLGL